MKGRIKLMLISPLENMKHMRAEKARELEYLKESVLDDELDSRLTVAEEQYVRESVEEYEEAKEELKLISETEEVAKENEINRILNADHDLSFEEMIGI
jgi:hypothetical protein